MIDHVVRMENSGRVFKIYLLILCEIIHRPRKGERKALRLMESIEVDVNVINLRLLVVGKAFVNLGLNIQISLW